ncbi:MAG TPA: hypothetical protein VM580_31125 [Labilithrix sp.]|jgi:hypothetical protein|nr:hypothetical protein [Labilithrix sp.]
MEERRRVRDGSNSPTLQMGIAFPTRGRILDPKTRNEVVALLARLLLEAARCGSEAEVRDDAP